jgi:hypothetical protein
MEGLVSSGSAVIVAVDVAVNCGAVSVEVNEENEETEVGIIVTPPAVALEMALAVANDIEAGANTVGTFLE